MMGKIVSNYADYLIVTNEDPYREDPQKIMEEIWRGIPKKKETTERRKFRIADRRQPPP